MKMNSWIQGRIIPLSLLLLSGMLLSGCHRASSISEVSKHADRDFAHFSGIMLWGKTPVRRAALFLNPTGIDRRPGNAVIELVTRSDGRFSIPLPPGHYLLRSSPTTMCPVKGEILILPGENRYRLQVHSLSFLTCNPGTITRF